MTPDNSKSAADLTRRITRKLQIQRGMPLTYHDLALMVATGAFEALEAATAKVFQQQTAKQLATPSQSGN